MEYFAIGDVVHFKIEDGTVMTGKIFLITEDKVCIASYDNEIWELPYENIIDQSNLTGIFDNEKFSIDNLLNVYDSLKVNKDNNLTKDVNRIIRKAYGAVGSFLAGGLGSIFLFKIIFGNIVALGLSIGLLISSLILILYIFK